MPGIDFSHAPPWLQWVIAGIAVLAAIAAVIGFVRKGWPVLSRFVTTINALTELPEFITEQAKFRVETRASLASQDTKIAEIHHEVQYNNGSSVKDAVDRIELGVKGLYDRTSELERTRPRPPKPITPARRRAPKKE